MASSPASAIPRAAAVIDLVRFYLLVIVLMLWVAYLSKFVPLGW